MDIDIALLLEPVSEDAPAGPELPYEPERNLIEEAFERPFSIQATSGDGGPEAAKDWREVVNAIIDQLGKTKDIWLPIYLARAGAQWGRLEVVEAGVAALAGLLDLYWEGMHPSLVGGVSGRVLACSSLNSRAEFLAPIERIALVTHRRFGAFNGADFQRFNANGESEPNYGFFRHALDELGPKGLLEVDAQLERIILAFTRAESLFREKAGADAPSFKPGVAALTSYRAAVRAYLPAAAEADPPNNADPSKTDLDPSRLAAVESGAVAGAPGPLANREDVIKALDAIIAYYRRHEPSSPVPLALERTRAWVIMPFMDVLMDIAPNSRDDLERVLFLSKSN